MSKSTKLATAALAGLLSAGFMTATVAHAADQTGNGQQFAQNAATATPATADKHSCAGKNSCKGKGGCKTGDNGCKGKNSCKGKGGCATDGSKKTN